MQRSRPPSVPLNGSTATSRRGARIARTRSRLCDAGGQMTARRLAGVFSLTGALTVCTLVACALFVPVTVFGAESQQRSPGEPVQTTVIEPVPAPMESPAGAADPDPSDAAAGGTHGGAASALTAASELVDGLSPSAGSLLATLPWGSGEGEVGLVSPDEGLTRGPEALAVSPDGRIAVLDSVNKRVLFLDSEGQLTQSAPVALEEPRFLAVTDTRVYVLDCDSSRRLVVMSWHGTVYGTAPLPTMPDVVTALFATSTGPCVEVAHDSVFRLIIPATVLKSGLDLQTVVDGSSESSDDFLDSLSGRPLDAASTSLVKLSFVPGTAPQASTFVTQDGTVVTRASVVDMGLAAGQTIEHLVSVDGWRDGLVIGARLDESSDSQGQASLLLRRFVVAADGTLSPASSLDGQCDMLLLIDRSTAYVGLPYVAAPDGRVFEAAAGETGYSIFVHTFTAASTDDEAGEV